MPELATSWPRFVRNRSDRFEAREVMVKIDDSPSLFFRGMTGSWIPIATAHGEGRAELSTDKLAALEGQRLVAARFVDGRGQVTETYPDESERLAARHRRDHVARRSDHRDHAAPRARVPHGAAVVAPA